MMAGYVSVPFFPSLKGEELNFLLDFGDVDLLFVGKIETWVDIKSHIPDELPMITFPNYGHLSKPLCDLNLVFGKPILIKEFLSESITKPEAINKIREALRVGMKNCIWLPENDDNYLKRKKTNPSEEYSYGF